MTVQFSVAVRDARLAAVASAVGPSPRLRMFTGAPPASTDSPETGTMLVDMVLPESWMAPPRGGRVSKSGAWEAPSAKATGALGYYRIYDAALAVCHEQGTVTAVGGGGDMTVSSVLVAAGQRVVVKTLTKVEGNA